MRVVGGARGVHPGVREGDAVGDSGVVVSVGATTKRKWARERNRGEKSEIEGEREKLNKICCRSN